MRSREAGLGHAQHQERVPWGIANTRLRRCIHDIGAWPEAALKTHRFRCVRGLCCLVRQSNPEVTMRGRLAGQNAVFLSTLPPLLAGSRYQRPSTLALNQFC
jgi:hypothetical protein